LSISLSIVFHFEHVKTVYYFRLKMESNSRDRDNNRDTNIDWSRFGLGSETAQRVRSNTSGFVDLSNDYGAGGHQASGANELFAEEQVHGVKIHHSKLMSYS
jgi:hypothetical protein